MHYFHAAVRHAFHKPHVRHLQSITVTLRYDYIKLQYGQNAYSLRYDISWMSFNSIISSSCSSYYNFN